MKPWRRARRVGLVALTLASQWVEISGAQEVLLTPSATQPSAGTFLVRSQTRWYQDGGEHDQLMTPFSIAGGVARGHSVSISGAGNFNREGSGMSDLEAVWKWRFLTKDSGPINTSRTALLTGLQFPSGTGQWATGSFNPSVGIAHTKISGRLGIGLSGLYKLNTGRGANTDPTGMNGQGSAWNSGASVTWRLNPAVYTAKTKGALYLSAEGGWTVSDAGSSIRGGPSLFYEATTWVVEVGWQYYPLNTGGMLPIDSMGIVGVRLFF